MACKAELSSGFNFDVVNTLFSSWHNENLTFFDANCKTRKTLKIQRVDLVRSEIFERPMKRGAILVDQSQRKTL